MSGRVFPTRPEDLTTVWLSEVLHENGIVDDVRVTGFAVEPMGELGKSSDVVRIRLEYNRESRHAPPSLIGKFPVQSVERVDSAIGYYYTEY